MVEPTPALDVAVEKAARPLNNILAAIVAELLGPAAEPTVVRDCVASIISQCSTYQNSEAIIQRLHQHECSRSGHDRTTGRARLPFFAGRRPGDCRRQRESLLPPRKRGERATRYTKGGEAIMVTLRLSRKRLLLLGGSCAVLAASAVIFWQAATAPRRRRPPRQPISRPLGRTRHRRPRPSPATSASSPSRPSCET